MIDTQLPVEFSRSHRRMREASLVPLINVVFLLLIFFLVAGRIEKLDVVPVDVPVADSGKLVETGPITILLGTHDVIVINDKLVALEQVRPTLAALLKEAPARVITLKAEARLPASDLLKLMEQIKAGGGKNVSLATQSF